MDSGSSSVLAAGRGQGDVVAGDRLSSLGDTTLGHVLSFLPVAEAARTATLSRRWRHVFPAVHTLSFGEAEACFRMGYRWYKEFGCMGGGNNDVRTPLLVAGVSAALHGRHRGAHAVAVPLRVLRVTFDESGFRGGENATTAVDGWLSYAVHGAGAGGEALEIDLRFDKGQICQHAYALAASGSGGGHGDAKMAEGTNAAAAAAATDEEEPYPGEEKYIVPRSLFSSCAVLRTLRLAGCWINLPSATALSSLHTLHLTRVTGRRGTIQRLIGACSSLADLTLEACGNLTELSVDGTRLRRLALRCCHGLASVSVDAPELQAFEYRGGVPAEPPAPPFLTFRSSPRKISCCALDFCGMERAARADGEVFGLMELFAGVERLHLTSARLGSSFVSHEGFFPCFAKLRNLEITGMLPDYDDDASAAIWTVCRVLEQTPRLETLSLFFLPEPEPVKEGRPRPYHVQKQVLDASHKLRYNPYARLAMAPGDVRVPCCLRKTTKEINLVHYQGSVGQRALARFLLCNAPVVEEVCWKVARGPLSIQTKLMEEIRGWVMNKSANMMFC